MSSLNMSVSALRKAKREKLLSSKRVRQTSLTGIDEITELQVSRSCLDQNQFGFVHS